MRAEGRSEFDLLSRLTGAVEQFSSRLRTGIGDDCAVLAGGGGEDLLLTSDLLVENVHFDRRWFAGPEIGEKALRVSLSDIAAMGGSPEFCLVGLALPPALGDAEIEAVYRGIRDAARRFGVTLAGGDLSSTAGEMVIDLMLLGTVESGGAVLRSGAAPGDQLLVSGTLGEAALGLTLLADGRTGPETQEAIRRQRLPEPRLALGRRLAREHWASSMIDLSDGLSSDLGHLCRAGGVGARIQMEALPCSGTYRTLCGTLSLDPRAGLLHGGEDYELLFTVPAERYRDFRRRELPVPVTRIGEIVEAGEGIRVYDPDGRSRELRARGFDHLRPASPWKG